MKNFKPLKVLCLCLLIVFSCSNDDNKPIDPRLEFVGSYRISETEVRVTNFAEGTDSTITIDIDPIIKFELDNDFDDDELLVDMENYIEDLYTATFLAFDEASLLTSINVSIDDDIIAQISANNFEINNVEFEAIITTNTAILVLHNEMDIEGEFNGDTIIFDFSFDIEFSTGELNFDGVSEGEKD